MAISYSWPLFFLLLLAPFFTGSNAAVFTLKNRCKETIWPGILSGAGNPLLKNGGLQLRPSETAAVEAPPVWSGRFWARNGCNFDESGKQGKCATGDCGGRLECGGIGGEPPASLAEFTLGGQNEDFYDVSLVDGFNIPVSVAPYGGSGNCSAVDCSTNLNLQCPEELQMRRNGSSGEIVGCKSACLAFREDKYCCTGEYNSPQACKPSHYSGIFKKACPTAYSYAYDDATSIFTCKGANYLIIFC